MSDQVMKTYIGIVLKDKDRTSRIISVNVPEFSPFATGELEVITEKKIVKSGSDENAERIGSVEVGNHINAVYIGDTNRRYPPDVRRGEQVRIYHYGNDGNDLYFWDSIGRNDNLRTTERLNFSIAAKPDAEDLNNNNTYYCEMDSEKKHVILSTSNKNGEKYRYLIKIDAANSTLSLCDDNNNEIYIESDTPRIRMSNRDGSILDLVKKNIAVVAPEDYILKAGRQVLFDTPAITSKNNAKGGALVWNAKSMVFNVQDTVKVKSPCIGLEGASVTDTLVAKTVQSEGYSTGSRGSMYNGVQIDLADGSASSGSNSPNTGGGGSANRHCTAWEQVKPAIELICECLSVLGCSNVPEILQLIEQSRMPLNRGE